MANPHLHLIPAYRTYFPPCHRLRAVATVRHRIWESDESLKSLYNRYIDKDALSPTAWNKNLSSDDYSCIDLLKELNSGVLPGRRSPKFELLPDPDRENIHCIHLIHSQHDSSDGNISALHLPQALFYALPLFGAEEIGRIVNTCGWKNHASNSVPFAFLDGKNPTPFINKWKSGSGEMSDKEIAAIRLENFKGEEKASPAEAPLLSKYFTVFRRESPVVLDRKFLSIVCDSNSELALTRLLQEELFSRLTIPSVFENLSLTWENNLSDPSIRQARLELTLGGNYEEVGVELSAEIVRALNWPLYEHHRVPSSFPYYDKHFTPNSLSDYRVLFRSKIGKGGETRRVTLSVVHLPPPPNAFSYVKQLSSCGAFAGNAYQWRWDEAPWSKRQPIASNNKTPVISGGDIGIPNKLPAPYQRLNGGAGLRYLEVNSPSKKHILKPVLGSSANGKTNLHFEIKESPRLSAGIRFESMWLTVKTQFKIGGGFSIPCKKLKSLDMRNIISRVKIQLQESQTGGKMATLLDAAYDKNYQTEEALLAAFLPEVHVTAKKLVNEQRGSNCFITKIPLGEAYGRLPKELFLTSQSISIDVEIGDSKSVVLTKDSVLNNSKLIVTSAYLEYLHVPLPQALWQRLNSLWYSHHILYYPPSWKFVHRKIEPSTTNKVTFEIPLYSHESLKKPTFLCVVFREENKSDSHFSLHNVYSTELHWSSGQTMKERFPSANLTPADSKYVTGISNETEKKSVFKEMHTNYLKFAQVSPSVVWSMDKLQVLPILTFELPTKEDFETTGGDSLYLQVRFTAAPTQPIIVTCMLRMNKWIHVDSLGHVHL